MGTAPKVNISYIQSKVDRPIEILHALVCEHINRKSQSLIENVMRPGSPEVGFVQLAIK